MRVCKLAMLVTLCAGTAAAQMTAQQVVEHSLKARGGAAAFAAVHTLSFSGVLEIPGGPSAPMAVWIATGPARIRVEITLPQGKMIEGYDGRSAWHVLPGASTAETLSGADANRVKDQALNGVDLIAGKFALSLAGQGTLDGHRYYAVTFTLPTGDAFTQYFDAHSWLAFHETYPGGSENISGYQRVGTVLLPGKYVSGPSGQPPATLLRQHTLLNPTIADAQFLKP